ncbi:unnamed protein product [Brachionus calyciflorus]|uniref:Uncharacterized protein n=1 Tax=Brachionus calyciflorus TaxID=104777 RepID=A0A814PEI3_9BILA|nr:unnamed protein product [Brachionus calyciflorus]
MNFETSFLKLIEFMSKYLSDLKNFNGQTLGRLKRSYPEHENQTNSQQNSQNGTSSDESTNNSSINKNVANAEFYRVKNQIRSIYNQKLRPYFEKDEMNYHI